MAIESHRHKPVGTASSPAPGLHPPFRARILLSTMSLLPILEFPDPRLRTVARAIDPSELDDAFRAHVQNMFETMYDAPGIGLAASQVDDHRRFMVIDVSENHDERRVFVNPHIVSREGEQVCQEGCLSVPTINADVTRSEKIVVQALDEFGKPFELAADGLLAVCIQHEMDHLEGKLFIDHLSPLKRDMVKRKLAKLRRSAA